MLGAKSNPARSGRLDTRRAPQQPIANVRDPKNLADHPATGHGADIHIVGMDVQLRIIGPGRR